MADAPDGEVELFVTLVVIVIVLIILCGFCWMPPKTAQVYCKACYAVLFMRSRSLGPPDRSSHKQYI